MGEVVQTGRRSMLGYISVATKVSAWQLLQAVVTLRGPMGLYPALMPSILGYSAFWGIQFAAREPILSQTGSPFVAGFLGSAAALTMCNWNNCVRLTMQRRALEGLPHVSWWKTMCNEYRIGGADRFFAGFWLRLLQTGLTMGFIFSAYDSLHIFRNLCSDVECDHILQS